MRFQAWVKPSALLIAGSVLVIGLYISSIKYHLQVVPSAAQEQLKPPTNCQASSTSSPLPLQDFNKEEVKETDLSTAPGPLLIKGTLKDTYKIQITIRDTNQTYMLDMTKRKSLYDQKGYYQNGRLLKPAHVIVNSYHQLIPYDMDQDGICELYGLQRINGITETDTIAYAASVWKWRYNQWTLMRAEIIPSD